MNYQVSNEMFNIGKDVVTVSHVQSYVCPNCGEKIYSHEEAKRIEAVVNAMLEKNSGKEFPETLK